MEAATGGETSGVPPPNGPLPLKKLASLVANEAERPELGGGATELAPILDGDWGEAAEGGEGEPRPRPVPAGVRVAKTPELGGAAEGLDLEPSEGMGGLGSLVGEFPSA